MAEQTYKNHTRFFPPFHFFLIPLELICFIASIVHVWKQPTPPNVLLVPVTFALMFATLLSRVMAMKAQDRVIRLEETLRLRSLGFDTYGLSVRQLIALRFASDGEVVVLAERAKREGLNEKQIKEAVVSWKADHERV